MTTSAAVLFGVLLFIAVASGYLLARWQQGNKSAKTLVGPDAGYFRGLRYLVDEQPDKAIEVFTRLLEVDSSTLETHFALGNLFRRRGETERAIRIHQNIIARPELPGEVRERALFALGEDYQKAGLLDRAEKLFREVSHSRAMRSAALAQLVNIYEQQKDWQQAIDCRRSLIKGNRPQDRIISHYYCELAEACLKANNLRGAREGLRQARSFNPGSVRGLFLRAELAERMDDQKLARRLLLKVLRESPQFAVPGFSRLVALLRNSGKAAEVPDVLKKLQSEQPELALPLAHAAILDRHMDDPVSLAAFRNYLRADRILGGILAALEARDGRPEAAAEPEALRRIRMVLRRLALDGPRFGCLECGYESRALAWRCPSCRRWDSTRPTANLKFDSHLGSEGYIQ